MKKRIVIISALTLLGAITLQLLLLMVYLLAFHAPKADKLPIIVQGNPDAVGSIAQTLEKNSGGAYAVSVESDNDVAQDKLRRQEAFAIYTPAFPRSSITVATASGRAVRSQVEPSLAKFDESYQKKVRVELAGSSDYRLVAQANAYIEAPSIQDIAPLSEGDQGGIGLFYVAFSAVFGGYLAAVALNLVRSKMEFRSQLTLLRSLGLALSAVLTSLTTAGIATYLTGAFAPDHFWPIAGITALTYLGVSLFASALVSLMGIFGTALVIVLFVILGTPASGGVMPIELTGQGLWRSLAPLLPTGAGFSAMRQAIYFGGVDIMRHLWVLICYVVVGFGALLLARRSHRSSADLLEDGELDDADRARLARVKQWIMHSLGRHK